MRIASRRLVLPFLPALLAVFGCASPAWAQDGLVLYGAGSLREAMTEVAAAFTASEKIPVTTQFGASGRMRERIEAGEKVDVFTSADLGHARKLVQDGRASVMALFAQNTLCLLAPARAGRIDSAGALDALLKAGVKVGVSPPKVDPLGDYTVELFTAAGRLKPGAEAALQGRAVVLDNPPGAPPSPSGDYYLDALNDGRVDLAVVYCSGRERYAKLSKEVAMVPFAPELQVGPQYGLAVVKGAKPEAMLLALRILSPEGQAILARNGYKAIGLPQGR
ncbi:extracellular solute-binding protein [Variovorax sp. dw_308]|uniref:extracellular solute-binding protein n=1 Tax=Variovorax sp. dw_308 TaxID=2721546 RepID=UPI001C46C8A5|nr:extracellular solute-binding protein [Variovorax sp. dw_308]